MFNLDTPNPFKDSELARMMGNELGAKSEEIALHDEIMERLQAIVFHAQVINWTELAFGPGWISPSIETALGWPHRCLNKDFLLDCINKEDLRQLDLVKLDSLPVYFQAEFRVCHSNGEWIEMFTHCHITPSSIYGMMLPATAPSSP